LAFANAGLIAEPSYTSYHSAPVAVAQKTIVSQPAIAYSSSPVVSSYHHGDHHYAATPVVQTYQQYQPEHYATGTSQQNIVRSAHGTVSQISKSVDTPTSSVRKSDTRVISNGYKTVDLQQPAYYSHVQPASVLATKAVISQPIVSKTLVQSTPEIHYASPQTYHYAQPAQNYHYAQPAQNYHYSQPAQTIQYAAAPQQYTYAQNSPVVATKIHYSPAVEVAHTSFESPITHYAW
jgi:hypothetical protein